MANADVEPDYLELGFGAADQSAANSMLDSHLRISTPQVIYHHSAHFHSVACWLLGLEYPSLVAPSEDSGHLGGRGTDSECPLVS